MVFFGWLAKLTMSTYGREIELRDLVIAFDDSFWFFFLNPPEHVVHIAIGENVQDETWGQEP